MSFDRLHDGGPMVEAAEDDIPEFTPQERRIVREQLRKEGKLPLPRKKLPAPAPSTDEELRLGRAIPKPVRPAVKNADDIIVWNAALDDWLKEEHQRYTDWLALPIQKKNQIEFDLAFTDKTERYYYVTFYCKSVTLDIGMPPALVRARDERQAEKRFCEKCGLTNWDRELHELTASLWDGNR